MKKINVCFEGNNSNYNNIGGLFHMKSMDKMGTHLM